MLHESWNKKVKNLSSSLKGIDAPYSISHKLGYMHGASDFQDRALEELTKKQEEVESNGKMGILGLELAIEIIKNLKAN